MNTDFWKGKNILITGHTGFKGGWLSLWLESVGSNVVGYSLEPSTNPALFNAARVSEGMFKSHIADVRDLVKLKQICEEFQPEVVFHMAAQPLVKYSYENPVETYSTNVMGTVHLLEVVRQIGCVKVVVNVTSDKCYENREWVWGYRENDPMGGYDPYSNSKGCAELVTSAYRQSFFNPSSFDEHGTALSTVRAGNVIGGGDWANNRLVPDIIRALAEGKTAVIRNPAAIRPWQYVLEPLRGYLMLAEKLWDNGIEYSEGWNFGPNDEDTKSVGWIAEHLVNLWGNGSRWEKDSAEHPHEATSLKLDCSKAKTRLAWRPLMDLTTALEKVVEWYRCYESGNNMREITLKQINEYTQLL